MCDVWFLLTFEGQVWLVGCLKLAFILLDSEPWDSCIPVMTVDTPSKPQKLIKARCSCRLVIELIQGSALINWMVQCLVQGYFRLSYISRNS